MMIDYLLRSSDDIVFIDEKKSKNELVKNILKVANALHVKGIKKAQIFTENSYEFTVLLLGCLKANVVPILLDSRLSDCGYTLLDEKVLEEFLTFKEAKREVFNENSHFFMLTSGSSGKPKQIKKSLNQILHEARTLRDFFGFKNSHIFFSSVTHQHFFGLIFKIFVPLVSEAKIVSKLLKYSELIIAHECRDSVLVTSPAILKRLSEFEDLSSLKLLNHIVTAGSALPLQVRKTLDEKIGKKIIEIYGSTETGACAYKKEDIFFPILHNDITKDENLGINISSPWCESFHNNDEIEFQNGGFILLGRNDRIIKLEDKRVSLINIEEFLLLHEVVRDCYVDKHPDFNRLVALVVLNQKGLELFKNEGKQGVVRRLKAYLKTKYNSVFLVRNFKIISKLPVNEQGKILKSAFKQALLPKSSLEWEEVLKEEKRAVYKTKTYVDLHYFTNHFPSFPLLPGFVQLGFVYELAKNLGLNLTHKNKIESVKFQSFSHPNEEIKVELELKNKKLYFKIYSNEKISSNGRILVD